MLAAGAAVRHDWHGAECEECRRHGGPRVAHEAARPGAPWADQPSPEAASRSSSGAGRQRAPCVGAQAAHRLDHARQPRLLGPEHRSAAVGREAVAVHVDHVDIPGTDGDALVDDARALVDERVQQPLENLLVGYRPALDAELARYRLDERRDLRVGDARASLVAVETPAALLAEAALRHQPLEDRRPALIRGQAAALADHEADVVAGEVAHRERSHREAETLHDPIDLLGGGALLQQELRFRTVEHEHAVADEAVAVAGEHRDLAERLPSAITVAMVCAEVRRPRTFSSSLMTCAGLKKCVPTTCCGREVLRRCGRCRASRCWWRGSHAGAATRSSRANTSLLHRKVLEHRLDDDVGRRQLLVVAHRRGSAPARARRARAAGCRAPPRPRSWRVSAPGRARAPRPTPRAPPPGCRRWRGSWRCRRPWCRRRSPPRLRTGSGCSSAAVRESGAPRARQRTRAPAPRAARCRGTRESTRARAASASCGGSVQAASMLSMIRHGASWPRAFAASLRRNSANNCGSTPRTCSSSSLARRSGRRLRGRLARIRDRLRQQVVGERIDEAERERALRRESARRW